MRKQADALIFVLGVGIGAVLSWQYAKKKYEKLAQEEIDSVKKVFAKRLSEDEQRTKQEERKTLSNALNQLGYSGDPREEKPIDGPYVISPAEYGEFYDYAEIHWTYYSDNILADENDELVDDMVDAIGNEALSHFGEYEQDAVFVRNDARKCDYEILMDHRKYSDVVQTMPHPPEV